MTDRQAENRRRQQEERNRLLAQIDRLRTRGPKHLDTEPRLRAARFIRDRYEALLRPKGALLSAEIQDKLESIGDKLKGIRIHRWMLRASEREVTPELVQRYEGRTEPQKKTQIYFALAEGLAMIGGSDPVEAQIDLLRATGLDSIAPEAGASLSKDGFSPEAGLVQLLRDFATDVAHRLDLGALFERAERLQAGWDPARGPVAITLEKTMQCATPASIFTGVWDMDALPALPSVALASFPMGWLPDATFELRGKRARSRTVRGSAHSWWLLHLSIAPRPGGGVTPCLVRTVRVHVDFDPEDMPDVDGPVEIRHRGDGLLDLHCSVPGRASAQLDTPVQIMLSKASSERLEQLEEAGRLHRRTTPDENLPHEGLPVAEIELLDVARLRLWLRDNAGRENHELERAPFLQSRNPDTSAGARWFTGPCLARDVEQALRSGDLRVEFSRWTSAFERSLKALEKARLAEVTEADEALRAQWAAERIEASRDLDENQNQSGGE